MNDSNDLNMNFYSCPLSFNEHICLAQHSIRQGRCVIFLVLFNKRGYARWTSAQQPWICSLDISSTTVTMLAGHQPLRHCPSWYTPPSLFSLGALPSRRRHQHLGLGTLQPRQESGFAPRCRLCATTTTARLLSSEAKRLVTALC